MSAGLLRLLQAGQGHSCAVPARAAGGNSRTDGSGDRPRLKGLLEGLLLRALCGRRLLRGNFVSVPLLGQLAVFFVERVDLAAGPSGGAGGTSSGRGGSDWAARQERAAGGWLLAAAHVTLRCKACLLGPEEEPPEAAAPGQQGGSAAQGPADADYAQAAAEAAAAAVGGRHARDRLCSAWGEAGSAAACAGLAAGGRQVQGASSRGVGGPASERAKLLPPGAGACSLPPLALVSCAPPGKVDAQGWLGQLGGDLQGPSK